MTTSVTVGLSSKFYDSFLAREELERQTRRNYGVRISIKILCPLHPHWIKKCTSYKLTKRKRKRKRTHLIGVICLLFTHAVAFRVQSSTRFVLLGAMTHLTGSSTSRSPESMEKGCAKGLIVPEPEQVSTSSPRVTYPGGRRRLSKVGDLIALMSRADKDWHVSGSRSDK